jgi:hypothetical protein
LNNFLGDDFLLMPARWPPVQFSPPGSPRVPEMPARMPLEPFSPPGSPRVPRYSPPGTPQYSPRGPAAAGPPAAGPPAPASLEETFNTEELEGLERDMRAALARVELAQERRKAWEAVAIDFVDFRCPIGGELMRDPVMIGDQRSYEKKAIAEWFSTQKRESKPLSSPMTREEVSGKLERNLSLKNAIAGAVEVKLAELRKRKRED